MADIRLSSNRDETAHVRAPDQVGEVLQAGDRFMLVTLVGVFFMLAALVLLEPVYYFLRSQ